MSGGIKVSPWMHRPGGFDQPGQGHVHREIAARPGVDGLEQAPLVGVPAKIATLHPGT